MKSHIDEAVASLATEPETKARFVAAQAKEDTEKAAILVDAKKLQEESKTLGEKSEAKLRPHERLALALAFIQIAIALVAITVLTRRWWLVWGSAGSAGAGMIVALTAFV